jgi:hypothetical protein
MYNSVIVTYSKVYPKYEEMYQFILVPFIRKDLYLCDSINYT